MNLNQLSRILYSAARITRDVNAVSRGPAATGRRIVRKAAYRKANGLLARGLNRLLKG